MTTNELSISYSQPSDSGKYVCVAENLAGSISTAPADITVFSPPIIENLPSDFILPEPSFSETITTCLATGSPVPKIYWKLNGKQITEKSIGNSR